MKLYNSYDPIKRLERSISDRYKFEVLKKFVEYLFSQGVSERRINRYIDFIKTHLIPNYEKDSFEEFTTDDLLSISAKISKSDKLSDSTKATYKRMLKRFARFLNEMFGLEININVLD